MKLPATSEAYLRNTSAYTILRAATLRQKLHINSFWTIYKTTRNSELGLQCAPVWYMFLTVANVFVTASYFFRPVRSKNLFTAVIQRKMSQ